MTEIPAGVRALLQSLRFDARQGGMAEVDPETLAFADRSQLTPLLTRFDLPGPARTYTEEARERNAIRVERVAAAYEEIAGAFEHVVLKGFTHVPEFIDDARLRVQYDLDLYAPARERRTALAALKRLGYEPIHGMETVAMDHLPTMIRKTGWEWRGDYFDPEIPVSVEVHFQFWDARTERVRVDGVEDFWARRNGARLDRVDTLGYAALHLARHLLRGNVRVSHAWELARFLHTHREAEFWRLWKSQHPASLRRMEVVAFLLARSWFGCELAPEAHEAIAELPDVVRRWFEVRGWSPVEGMFRPNKHEVLLHLGMVQTTIDRLAILKRRLIPAMAAGPVDAVHVPREQMTVARRITERMRHAQYTGSRLAHHLLLFAPTLWDALREWPRAR